jgi:hypothetical protein
MGRAALVITTLEGWLLRRLLGRAGLDHIAIFASLLFWSWLWACGACCWRCRC